MGLRGDADAPLEHPVHRGRRLEAWAPAESPVWSRSSTPIRTPARPRRSPYSAPMAGGEYQVTLATAAYAGVYQVLVDERKIRASNAPQTCKATQSSAITV